MHCCCVNSGADQRAVAREEFACRAAVSVSPVTSAAKLRSCRNAAVSSALVARCAEGSAVPEAAGISARACSLRLITSWVLLWSPWRSSKKPATQAAWLNRSGFGRDSII